MIRALPAGRSPGTIALGILGTLFLAVGLTGCPGSLDPSLLVDAGGGGGGGGGQACTTAQAKAIFTAHGCAGVSCHAATNPASGFEMASADYETRLVGTSPNAMSLLCGSGGPYLVANSSPASGLLLTKLYGSAGLCGSPMPLTGSRLTANELDCIQTWANGMVMTGGGGGNTDAGGGQ